MKRKLSLEDLPFWKEPRAVESEWYSPRLRVHVRPTLRPFSARPEKETMAKDRNHGAELGLFPVFVSFSHDTPDKNLNESLFRT